MQRLTTRRFKPKARHRNLTSFTTAKKSGTNHEGPKQTRPYSRRSLRVRPGVTHGYLREADGTLTFPIDYPGAVDTHLFGINDKGWMVGDFVDTEGVTHGLFLSSPTRFVVLDAPGSSYTVLSAINNQGTICGYYDDFD